MEIEIIFIPSSTPKVFKNATSVYTKGDLLCVRDGDLIFKYPLMHVFSVVHAHGPHLGSAEERKSR